MKIFKNFFLLSNIVAVVSLFFAYLAPKFDPHQISIFSFFGLSYPILVIINVCFVIYWLFKDLKYALLSIVALGMGYQHFKKYVGFNVESVTSDSKISVVSFNISNALSGYDTNANRKEVKREKMVEFLSKFEDEDIICFQEVGSYASDLLKKTFAAYHKHITPKGAVILSKHKIINKGIIEFGTITNSCVWADILVGLDTIRFYSYHFQSNMISKDADEVIDNADLQNEKTWKGIEGILGKYKYTHLRRSDQAKLIKQHIRQCPYAVIVSGDMNDIPLSYTYETLVSGLQDAFLVKGKGMSSTFTGRIPFLRIDYIFASPQLKILKYNRIAENYSDHFPIAAIFALGNKPQQSSTEDK